MAFSNKQITATSVEATEFMDLSRKYRVTGVPKTIVNESIEILGALPEADFIETALQKAEPRPRRTGQARTSGRLERTRRAGDESREHGLASVRLSRMRTPVPSCLASLRGFVLFVSFVSFVFPVTAAAQGKKVYISVDMEGISGVNGDDQTGPGGAEYGRARKLMAEDANAAIRGAFEGGATDVLVNDSHGGQRNLLPEDLDPARAPDQPQLQALRDDGRPRRDVRRHRLRRLSRQGRLTARGCSPTPAPGVVRDLQVNGRSVGEGGMNAALAAWYGVPVVAVTGDDVAVDEVKAVVPGIRGVVVKRAINVARRRAAPPRRRAARHPGRRPRGRAGGEEAGARAPEPPTRCGCSSATSPSRRWRPRSARCTQVAPDTVQFTRATMPEAYRLIRVLYRFINTD